MTKNSKIHDLLVQIEEIIQKSGKTGIVTVCFGPGNSVSANSEQVFDVDPKTLTLGCSEGWRPLLIAKLGNMDRAGIVVRNVHESKRAAALFRWETSLLANQRGTRILVASRTRWLRIGTDCSKRIICLLQHRLRDWGASAAESRRSLL
jgi:hypothetical protein